MPGAGASGHRGLHFPVAAVFAGEPLGFAAAGGEVELRGVPLDLLAVAVGEVDEVARGDGAGANGDVGEGPAEQRIGKLADEYLLVGRKGALRTIPVSF